MITIVTDPVQLHIPCSKIARDDNNTIHTLKEMAKYIANPSNHAAGLALPQAGIQKRGFVCRIGNMIEIVINPIITKLSETTKEGIESCLYLPDTPVTVNRSIWIEVKYQYLKKDGKLATTTKFLHGPDARVFQHEFDHLNGRIITDYQKEEVA